jgi:membrane protein required for colicin V production
MAFLAIALGVMILAGLLGRIIRWSVRSIGLGWADRLIGAVFGLVKGCVLVTLAVMAITAFVPRTTWFQQSRLSPYFLSVAHQTAIVTPAALGERIRQGVTLIRNAQPNWLRPSERSAPGPLLFNTKINPGRTRA